MVASLAQAIALTSAANCHLAMQTHLTKDVYSGSSFASNHSLYFVLDNDDREIVGTTINQWFKGLFDRGVQRISFFSNILGIRWEDIKRIGRPDGAQWGLVSQAGADSRLWWPTWIHNPKDEDPTKKWAVAYLGHQTKLNRPEVGELDQEGTRLIETISKVDAFAKEMNLTSVSVAMTAALRGFDAKDPFADHPYADVLLPYRYSAKARHLVAGGLRAFYLAGPGSFMDFHPSDERLIQEHAVLAQELFSASLEAIEAGMNSFRAK
jgi:hypothetical protein